MTSPAAPILLACMRILLAVVLVGALTGAGCHGQHSRNPAAFTSAPVSASSNHFAASGSELLITPETSLSGKIVRVNNQGRFVVVNFPVGQLPALDQHLNIYRAGLKVGEVRVTGPQYDDNIVGDLIAGEAQPGDSVRDR